MLESKIEKEVCNFAKKLQIDVYKFVSPSSRGVPDRIFLKKGIIIFIEFKAPGKLPTTFQQSKIKKFIENGFKVFVIDNIEEGIKIIKKEFGSLC